MLTIDTCFSGLEKSHIPYKQIILLHIFYVMISPDKSLRGLTPSTAGQGVWTSPPGSSPLDIPPGHPPSGCSPIHQKQFAFSLGSHDPVRHIPDYEPLGGDLTGEYWDMSLQWLACTLHMWGFNLLQDT